ncbi:hypothetical protein BDP27DRAFT_1441990 [Rhodocollybia butyracea]|uniref:Uncharacterized protein n=1 Tax=Rhodocollybia butyracea TaxID=206335 RepID=A0A9P5UFH9_9AGAR|nr:hypothetical protein BDP27DRAFT_1441990 [Rhodocollybia butyracea]
MQSKLSAIVAIVLLAAWGGQALSIDRVRVHPTHPTDRSLDVEDPGIGRRSELHARVKIPHEVKETGKKALRAGARAGLQHAADMMEDD